MSLLNTLKFSLSTIKDAANLRHAKNQTVKDDGNFHHHKNQAVNCVNVDYGCTGLKDLRKTDYL
ncbi:hypothetical protein DS565_00930 [Salmonella enterica subsp. enterica serovar Bareilly]|nr:hypothetical protein [Salmonella enterica subsp. enterica serovar Bareilly]